MVFYFSDFDTKSPKWLVMGASTLEYAHLEANYVNFIKQSGPIHTIVKAPFHDHDPIHNL